MSGYNLPLRAARLGSLAMTFAWGVIAFGVGINADVKLNNRLKPFGFRVQNIFSTDAVVTTVCGLIWAASLTFLVSLATTRPNAISPFSTRSLPVQAGIMGFLTCWLFATLVPYTHFFRVRSAAVSTAPATVRVPYTIFGFLRLVAILPWITFLFSLITTAVLVMAFNRRNRGDVPPVRAIETTEGKEPVTAA